MTDIALTDREPVLTAIAGTRIPRRAWSNVRDLSGLLSEAGRIREVAQEQAEALRRRAYREGRAAGAARAQAQAAQYLLEASREARAFAAREERIIALAVSIVARIAPALDDGKLVAALAAAGLRALHDERHIRVRVNPAAAAATRAMLEGWQSAHPEIETVQLVADPQLEPLGCVVESEMGRIEVGLAAQLERIREALTAAAAESSR